jgi:hypothetical protein
MGSTTASCEHFDGAPADVVAATVELALGRLAAELRAAAP